MNERTDILGLMAREEMLAPLRVTMFQIRVHEYWIFRKAIYASLVPVR